MPMKDNALEGRAVVSGLQGTALCHSTRALDKHVVFVKIVAKRTPHEGYFEHFIGSCGSVDASAASL